MSVNNPSCPVHRDSRIRRYRTVGPQGPGVYLQCVPERGEPHLLSAALAPASERAGLTVRATVSDAPAPAPYDAPDAPDLPFGLTKAELTVLKKAAQGLTVSETADTLHKGAETVKTQRNRIILKFGARNITHAVCIAAE